MVILAAGALITTFLLFATTDLNTMYSGNRLKTILLFTGMFLWLFGFLHSLFYVVGLLSDLEKIYGDLIHSTLFHLISWVVILISVGTSVAIFGSEPQPSKPSSRERPFVNHPFSTSIQDDPLDED
jgi:hypothetical protein